MTCRVEAPLREESHQGGCPPAPPECPLRCHAGDQRVPGLAEVQVERLVQARIEPDLSASLGSMRWNRTWRWLVCLRSASSLSKPGGFARLRLESSLSPAPGWRNWQTQRTQNPPTFGSWGFDPPSRHQQIKDLCPIGLSEAERPKSFAGCFDGSGLSLGVESRHWMGWIEGESGGFILPEFVARIRR